MAIVGRPELLFLDEPTVGLDMQAREALWQVVRDLLHEGCSIVLTTHYLEEAEALADRVAVVTHGRQVASGTVDEIRAHVSRKNILVPHHARARSITAWPEVQELRVESGASSISTLDAEAVLRRLLAADAGGERHRSAARRARRGVRGDHQAQPNGNQRVGETAMSTPYAQMSRSRVFAAYLGDIRFELTKMARTPAFAVPTHHFPGDVLPAVRHPGRRRARQRAVRAAGARTLGRVRRHGARACSASACRWRSSASRVC